MNANAIYVPVSTSAFAWFVEEQAERADIGDKVIAFTTKKGSIAMCDTVDVAKTLIARLAGNGVIASIVKQ